MGDFFWAEEVADRYGMVWGCWGERGDECLGACYGCGWCCRVLLSEGCGMRCRVEERPSVAGAAT
ncbi:hypothetical protein IG631_05792 [Alternaria alternata]|nr:hypothetical protein IG631_05792 [Alternaria alternata]